jgi:hypothetical protein
MKRKPQITQITSIYSSFLAKGVDNLHQELVSDFLCNLGNLRFLLSFFIAAKLVFLRMDDSCRRVPKNPS